MPPYIPIPPPAFLSFLFVHLIHHVTSTHLNSGKGTRPVSVCLLRVLVLLFLDQTGMLLCQANEETGTV